MGIWDRTKLEMTIQKEDVIPTREALGKACEVLKESSAIRRIVALLEQTDQFVTKTKAVEKAEADLQAAKSSLEHELTY